jgi:hypothetical protein
VVAVTNTDWGRIHAKAWTDPKFRKLLEKDPTKAIKAYGREVGKNFTKMLKLTKKPKRAPKRASEIQLVKFHPHPPSCC